MSEKKTAPRYRTTELAMWGDEKFRELSKPGPNAQTIFQFLLTGPCSTAIPGIVIAKPMVIASYYDWDATEGLRKGFTEAFGELLENGMAKADARAGLIWLPGAAKGHRAARPANPNVVIGWRKLWPEVPECALKGEALRALKSFVEALGEPFAKGFAKAFPQISTIQEQEQEQEQEQVNVCAHERGEARPGDLQRANDLLQSLNRQASRNHQATSAETMKPILARLRGDDGEPRATVEDLELVIAHRCATWLADAKRSEWLRPQTLFAADKVAKNIEAARTWDADGRPPMAVERKTAGKVADLAEWMA